MSKRNRSTKQTPATEPQRVTSADVGSLQAAINEQTATSSTVPPKSIRSLVMTSLLAGVPRAEIATAIQRYFPTSRAAVLSAKHISWYAGRMKKDGVVLPKAVVAAGQVQAEQAEEPTAE